MVANVLKSLISEAVSYINNDKIKFDSDKAAAISNRLGKISSEIEMAAAQLEGPISEAQPVWTGQAAEAFFKELTLLINATKKISEKISENRKQLDNAARILTTADNNIEKDVSTISENAVFKY